MNAIVIADRNWGIGSEGKLLAHLPGDLKHFKKHTQGNIIIIGRETFESMGSRLLPDRETVILSGNTEFNPGCRVVHSLEELLKHIKGREKNVFAAGGEAVYKLLLPYCRRIFVTKIHETFKADRFFPNLDEKPEEFVITAKSEILEENSVKYQFFEYERKTPGCGFNSGD